MSVLYTIRRRPDGWYDFYLPKCEQPAGEIFHKTWNDAALWGATADVMNEADEKFHVAVAGPTLRATARALYLTVKTVPAAPFS